MIEKVENLYKLIVSKLIIKFFLNDIFPTNHEFEDEDP